MSTNLNREQIAELHEWLEEKSIPIANIGKNFSDGVELAKLLKQMYPKLLDLSNYPSRTSSLMKINNWSALNTKVLAKLKIFQTKSRLEDFANGRTEAIEALLYKVMMLQKAEQAADKPEEKTEEEEKWEENGEVMTITVQKTIDDNVIETKRKLILFSIYEALVKDVQAQRATLNGVESRISQQLRTLELRDQRIAELRKKLDLETTKTLL